VNTADVSLPERLAAARLEVEALERAGGAAVLDGKAADPAALNAARANVEALLAAELEGERRAAASASERAAERRAEAAEEARQALADYTEATLLAEGATKALAAALRAAQTTAKTLQRAALAAGGGPIGGLEDPEVRRTLSRLIVGELVKVAHPRGFGDIKWPSVPAPDWSMHTTKYIGPAVAAAIERGKSYV
jgi:hypothetical protein